MLQNSHRNARKSTSIPWAWLIVGGILIGAIFLKWFTHNTNTPTEDNTYLTVTPYGAENTISISMTGDSKVRIHEPQKLYATDSSVSVDGGGIAHAENDFLQFEADGNSEVSYVSSGPNENTLRLLKGRAWTISKTLPVTVELKNFSVRIGAGDIVFVEQNNAYSIAYAIQGTSTIHTSLGTYSLEPGNRIMIGASDLLGTGPLSSLSGPIDESILQHTLFQRNNGITYLSKLQKTGTGETSSTGGTTKQISGGKYIEIQDPVDGGMIKKSSVTVSGKLLSKEVKRVTINDKDTSISPVNETFILQNIAVDADIVNLVYKAYDANNSLLEKGVIIVYGPSGAKSGQSNALVSNNFPISNKDFKITFPTENPYKTTDSIVKVQGSVPKDTVSYIIVNDYRLQKFTPNSTIWYYFANTDTKSMVEGINLYTIKFYGNDDTLLYSQLFTIVKESKNAQISGEIIR